MCTFTISVYVHTQKTTTKVSPLLCVRLEKNLSAYLGGERGLALEELIEDELRAGMLGDAQHVSMRDERGMHQRHVKVLANQLALDRRRVAIRRRTHALCINGISFSVSEVLVQ